MRDAMALGTAGFTVALCVERLEANGQHPRMGPLAVTGASGGVGSLAVNVLARLGYEVHAISGKAEAHDFLRSLGASEVHDRRQPEADARPLERATLGGAIDNVGGETLAWLIRRVRPWGNVVSVGLAGGSELHTTVMPFILRGVSLLGVTSAGCPRERRRGLWARLAGDLAPAMLDTIVTHEVALEELQPVFEAMLAGTITGRVLVRTGMPA